MKFLQSCRVGVRWEWDGGEVEVRWGWWCVYNNKEIHLLFSPLSKLIHKYIVFHVL